MFSTISHICVYNEEKQRNSLSIKLLTNINIEIWQYNIIESNMCLEMTQCFLENKLRLIVFRILL